MASKLHHYRRNKEIDESHVPDQAGGGKKRASSSPRTKARAAPRPAPKKQAAVVHTGASKLFETTSSLYNAAQLFEANNNLEDSMTYYMLTVHSLRNYAAWGLGLSLATEAKKQKGVPDSRTAATAEPSTMQANPHKAIQVLLPKILDIRQKVVEKINGFTGCLDFSEESDVGDSQTPNLNIQPTILKGPDLIRFSDIVSSESIKQDIRSAIIYPHIMPLMYEGTSQKNFLFYGSPGTGKTRFAKAVATELKTEIANLDILFFAPRTDELKGKYVGETEKKITSYFRSAEHQAKEKEAIIQTTHAEYKVKSIIFIDEIDSLARERSNDPNGTNSLATNALLQMMDGFQKLDHVSVIGATNYPWQIDTAIRSRFSSTIHISLPTSSATYELLKYYLIEHVRSVMNSRQRRKFNCGEQTKEAKEANGGKEDDTLLKLPMSSKGDYNDTFSKIHKVIGIADSELKTFATELASRKVPYSPADIDKLCKTVCKAAADKAREANRFHKIVLQKPFEKELAADVVEMLSQLDGMYASARTFAKLRDEYGSSVPDAPSVGISSQLRLPITIDMAQETAISTLNCEGGRHFVTHHTAQIGDEAKAMWATLCSKQPDLAVYLESNPASTEYTGFCLYFASYAKLPMKNDTCELATLNLMVLGELDNDKLTVTKKKKSESMITKSLLLQNSTEFILQNSITNESRAYAVPDNMLSSTISDRGRISTFIEEHVDPLVGPLKQWTRGQERQKADAEMDDNESIIDRIASKIHQSYELRVTDASFRPNCTFDTNHSSIDEHGFNITLEMEEFKYAVTPSETNKQAVVPSEQLANIEKLKQFEDGNV